MLDVLSGGRLELGLGAGYSAEEYRGSGLDFPAGPERAARLEESVSLLKAVFEGGPVTLGGRYYPLDAYKPAIRPVQSPRPRLMLAAARRRLLALAGREADIASLAVTDWHENATLEATRQKIAWLRDAAGERFHDIEIETLVQVRFAPSRERRGRGGIGTERSRAGVVRLSPLGRRHSGRDRGDAARAPPRPRHQLHQRAPARAHARLRRRDTAPRVAGRSIRSPGVASASG